MFESNKINANRMKQRMKKLFTGLTLILSINVGLVNFVGCCSYSFTGASVLEHLKTISIPIADDRSGSGEPGLRESFTNTLVQKFIDDNTFQVAEKLKSDAVLECAITSLKDAPAIVTAGENVSSRRITISIQVIYRDLVKRTVIYEKTFSNYGDYILITDRAQAIQTAVDKITEDILLDTVSGW